MKKMGLDEQLGISSSTLAKMRKGELVLLGVLEKICEVMECDFGDLINYESEVSRKNNI